MGMFAIFNKEEIAKRKADKQVLKEADKVCDNYKDAAFIVIDFKNPTAVLKQIGRVEYNKAYNGEGILETTSRIVEDMANNGQVISVPKEVVKKLYTYGRLKTENIKKGEVTEDAERFVQQYIVPSYRKPIQELALKNIEVPSDISNNVLRALDFCTKAFMYDYKYCVVGRLMKNNEVKSYLLYNRYSSVEWADKWLIVELIKQKEVYGCVVSGDNISGTNGFQIRDTLTITEENFEYYMEAFKKYSY